MLQSVTPRVLDGTVADVYTVYCCERLPLDTQAGRVLRSRAPRIGFEFLVCFCTNVESLGKFPNRGGYHRVQG